jgi:hypothetical protein
LGKDEVLNAENPVLHNLKIIDYSEQYFEKYNFEKAFHLLSKLQVSLFLIILNLKGFAKTRT